MIRETGRHRRRPRLGTKASGQLSLACAFNQGKQWPARLENTHSLSFGPIAMRPAADHDESFTLVAGEVTLMRAKIFQHPSSVLAVCCLVALSGCADKVLNNQLANTRESIDQARMAGAAEKAPAEFNAAIDKIGRADAAAKDRENKQAMRLAQEAQVDANLARARTDSAQASIAANELAKSNQVLRDIANRVRNQNQ